MYVYYMNQNSELVTTDAKTSNFLTLRKLLHATASKVLLNKEDADDALQELFIKVWQNERTDVGSDQKRAFMFTALRNICIDIIRRRKLKAEAADYISYRSCDTENTADRIDNRDKIEQIRLMSRQLLSGMILQVFELYTTEGLDYGEIAVRLGISPEVTRSYMYRARKILRNNCNNLLND